MEDNEKNYILLLRENDVNNTLKVEGIVESPENIYHEDQINKIHLELTILSNKHNYTLDYLPLKNWSHGYYFYEYINNL